MDFLIGIVLGVVVGWTFTAPAFIADKLALVKEKILSIVKKKTQ